MNDMFNFSQEYKKYVVVVFVFSILMTVIWTIITNIQPTSKYVSYVDETNQPNCVVGAYIMLANEVLDKKLFITTLQRDYPKLTNEVVSIGTIPAYWDDMFPTNHLRCVYDDLKPDTFNYFVHWGEPYIWVGKWNGYKDKSYHACLVYFHSDHVTFRHFIYDPKTKSNYEVNKDYKFLFSQTIRLYNVE